MHPPNAQVALTVATHLSTEALGNADHAHGHLLFGDGFVHVHRSERVFGGGDHVVLVRLNTVHNGLKVAQIRDTFVGLAIHHDRGLDKGVVSLTKEVHRILLESKFQSSKVALEEVESAARDFGSPL